MASQNNDLKFPVFPLPPPTNYPPFPPKQPPPHHFPSPPNVKPPHNPPSPPKIAPPHSPISPKPSPFPSPSTPPFVNPPPHYNPPPTPKPPRPLVPPPPPHHNPPTPNPPRPLVPPPPPHHSTPPPAPKPPRPSLPPPHPFSPPPAPAPGHHSTVIVVVFVSLGGLFFLAFLSVALCCFIKKRRKRVERKVEIINFDEHRRVHEDIVQGPHGEEMKIVTIEEDLHIDEEIKTTEKGMEGSHVRSPHDLTQAVEMAKSSASTSHQSDPKA